MSDMRILIVADDLLARAGLATLLADQPGCLVTGRSASLDDLRAAIELYRPEVVLWDLGWQPAAHLQRLRDLAARLPVAVLLPDETYASQAWTSGVRTLLRRDAQPAQLAAALVATGQRLVVIDSAFAGVLAQQQELPKRDEWGDSQDLAPVEELTTRELEVLRLLAEGLPNKAIAIRLGISEHTIKFHVNAILGKLNVASRTEAVVRATRLGLILL